MKPPDTKGSEKITKLHLTFFIITTKDVFITLIVAGKRKGLPMRCTSIGLKETKYYWSKINHSYL